MTGDTGFHGTSFRLKDRAVREFPESALAAEIADPDVFFWIDLESADTGRLRDLLARLDVDTKVAARLDAPEILPWIVERPNCVAFRLYEIDHPERHLDTSAGLRPIAATPLLVVLGRDFLLTWHPRPLDVVQQVRTTCPDSFQLAGKTPGFVVFLFLQRCLYDYADLNLANDNFLDNLEPSVGGGHRDGVVQEISIAGRNILTLKKLTTSLHNVLMLLATKRTPFVSEEARASFHALQDNAMSVRAAVDSSRDLLSGVVGALHAEAAERTSRIATVLTLVSVVILPLSLLAGLWGMNFNVLPLVNTEHGFWILLAAMAALAAVLVWIFARLGWIGGRPSRRH